VLAVRAGVVSEADVAQCQKALRRPASKGRKKSGKTLLGVMRKKGLLTREGERKLEELAVAEKALERVSIPGYELLEVLGKGGMGVVYKARQLSLQREVALKLLEPDVARDQVDLERFMTEARALARLNHENIIAGIDVGEANGYHYFAMEYVEGDSLDAVIQNEGALSERRALGIGMQVCRALQHAAKCGLVHRDVKPQNIMLTRHDQAKLCDLGLAVTANERKAQGGDASERGQAVGTPHYVSPEQARGERNVKTPFEGSSAMVLMTRHLTEEPVPAHKRRSGVSRAMSELIGRMMAKDPADRFQEPKDALEAMERILKGQGPAPLDLGSGSAPSLSARGGGGAGAGAAARSERRRARPIPDRTAGGGVAAIIFVGALCLGGAYAMWRYTESEKSQAKKVEVVATDAEEAEARKLLLAAADYFKTHKSDREGSRRKFQAVVDAYPNSRAATSALKFIENDLK
ncbi:MAG: serine/threonine-protein kinase, partial [Planctomycetota bacterium]|jgi:serine/threonine-protein kinase